MAVPSRLGFRRLPDLVPVLSLHGACDRRAPQLQVPAPRPRWQKQAPLAGIIERPGVGCGHFGLRARRDAEMKT